MTRSLVYLVACTLDGYIAGVDGAFDFFTFEGPHVPDLIAEFPEMIAGHGREPLGITADLPERLCSPALPLAALRPEVVGAQLR